MHSIYSTKFDADKMIDRFGGISALHRTLTNAGCTMSYKTVEKWRERKNIPPDAVATLVRVCMEKGEDFDLREYLEEQTT